MVGIMLGGPGDRASEAAGSEAGTPRGLRDDPKASTCVCVVCKCDCVFVICVSTYVCASKCV
jgi:hypothetical protein